ncbi:MAG: xanthan lyase [Alistipes sp.]|nr:xanthan lyase [Alistipes sp.]
MKKISLYTIIAILILCMAPSRLEAQGSIPSYAKDSVAKVLQRITLSEVAGSYVKVESVRLRDRGGNKVIEVRASVELAYYPMRGESVQYIYDQVSQALPEEFRRYTLLIYSDGKLIDNLIPQYYNARSSDIHFTNTSSTPLITRQSAISQPTRGLRNRHIALWQSHGRYFKQNSGLWSWQRSRLWETVEDLYTQSYVLPYLVPMLERAGATVLLPRERSTQSHELIIDNDKGIDSSRYTEHNGAKQWEEAGSGFAHLQQTYTSGHNPFEDGTARMVATQTSNRELSSAIWGGNIPESGLYSVYVSYSTMDESVSDAHYTIHASGGEHNFLVNQRMGGGMWICLGEFYFEAGDHTKLVSLSNYSASEGVVTADAVKIGGGMGNIVRGDGDEGSTSGYPRFTEGARYWLQWSGFTEEVYAAKDGKDDYKEDYMSRAHWVNALMGGSARLRDEEGKNIPIDLAFAFHSDAGVRLNDDIIGTLGIYCTKENNSKFDGDNISRMRSRDLTDIVMTQIVSDIRHLHEPNWTRRGMWDRAYYEARMPECPTMLLELLSHQNFADMRYGLDPSFRFDVSRAIYKGMLRYLSSQYDMAYVVQPLPVNSFAVELQGNEAHLSWCPTIDELEPTATPDYYILYTRIGDGGFNCGERIDATSTTVQQDPDKIYSYRITAVNAGGESFDSETLSACVTSKSKGHVMIVNGFDRVSAPMSVQGDSIAGFYNRYDSGAAYIQDISFIGEQTIFDRSLSRSENDNYALGTSYNDYETRVIAGNSFDYPALHGKAIVAAGYSFSSASYRSVEEGVVDLEDYAIVDLILGKQRTTAIGRGAMGYRYEVLSEALQQRIKDYTASGGGIMVSGSYMLTDLWHGPEATDANRSFAQDVLHVGFSGNMASRNGRVVTSNNRFLRKPLDLEFNTEPTEQIYAVESPEIVTPRGNGANVAMRYTDSQQSAAVAYSGKYRTFVMGFPFETIENEEKRDALMAAILKHLSK